MEKARPGIAKKLLTSDADSIVNDADIEIIIEVMGGIEPARKLLLTAMKNGKSVITANKALLAKHGAELYDAASANGVDLYYEASVGGAIPILRPLRDSIVGDHVTRIMGIVNGTTNYILTKMDEDGSAFVDVLKKHKHLGMPKQIQLLISKAMMLLRKLQFWPVWHFIPESALMMFSAKVSPKLLPPMSLLQKQSTM